MHNQAFAFIGAQTLLFQLLLKDGQRTIYRFSDYGIPQDAKILYVNYTPSGGGLFPLEMHGNVPTRRFLSNEVVLYPMPFAADKTPEDTEVNVMVSWVPRTASDESWQSLVDAFEAYAHARYSSMIVPANVAVESALSRVLTGYLERFVSKRRIEDFLENAATYGHQLNVLLPVIASLKSLPLLPDHVRGALNRLREFRNDLAHAGTLKQPLDPHTAAEALCGALFGIHYVRYIEDQLSQT
jgi:AcrR family transcriptional regulator